MLDNTVNNNSIFNTKYAVQHGQQQLYLQYNVCWTTRSTITLSSIQRMLDNTVNNNSIFNTTYAGQHGQQQLYLQYKVCWILCKMVALTTHLVHKISTKNPFLYFSQFSLPYSTLSCSKNHP